MLASAPDDQNAGMKAARAHGVRLGPKPKLTRQQIERARKLIAEGERRTDVADLLQGRPGDALPGA